MRFPARLQLRARQDPLGAASPEGKDTMAASKSASRAVPGRAPRRTPARPAGAAALRVLPQVHAILEREEVRRTADRHGRALVAGLVRERSEEHTSELQSLAYLVCRLLL